MAKYLLTKPAFTHKQTYVFADVRSPVAYECDDDVLPSRTWKPMDKAAQEALKKLQAIDDERYVQLLKRAEKNPEIVVPPRSVIDLTIVGMPEPEPARQEPDTMSAMTARRVSDRSPI